MIGHAPEDPAQPVLGLAESEAFFQHFAALLEDQNLQAVANRMHLRRRVAQVERPFAYDEGFITRQVALGIHALPANPHAVEQFSRLSLGIEEGDLAARPRSRARLQNVDRKGVLLLFPMAEIEARPQVILPGIEIQPAAPASRECAFGLQAAR